MIASGFRHCTCVWEDDLGVPSLVVRDTDCDHHGDLSLWWQRTRERARVLAIDRISKRWADG